MSRRRSPVVAVVALALIAIAGAILAQATREPAVRPGRGDDAGATALTAPLAVYRRPARAALPAALHGIPIAEARAYAAAGEEADGRAATMELDAEARAALGQARDNLASQDPAPGAGRPHVLPGGTVVAIAPRRRAGATGRAEPGPGGAAPTQASAVARELATLAGTGDVSLRDGTHVISGRGAWAGISLHPDDGPLRIVDAGEGGHAFTVRSNDYGTVRVNGGIVVPGRHYRIDGPVTISAAVEVGVDIVPLDAVPEYWDRPFSLPTGAG